MKKLIILLTCTIFFVACSNKAPDIKEADTKDIITVTSLNSAGEQIEIEVPYKPKKIAVFNLAVVDMLDFWGLADCIVGMPKDTKIDYLTKYIQDENITNLGTLKEVDFEKLMSSEPEIIFISGRLSGSYDELSKIAPVVYIDTGHKTGYIETTKKNIETIAKIFGVEDNQTIDDFNKRIEKLSEFAAGKNAVIGLVTSSSFNTLGNKTRGSIIGNEIGFENLANDVDATHGNESSFELLVKLDPEYIFVIDRDSVVNVEGAELAKDVMENELVAKTKAYKNNNIYYLTPEVWYLVEGGITSTDMMLKDLENIFIK